MIKFEVIKSAKDIRAVWRGTHAIVGDGILRSYKNDFDGATQEAIKDAIRWQIAGEELLLVAYDTDNPAEIFAAWVVDFIEDYPEHLMLSYWMTGKDASFGRQSERSLVRTTEALTAVELHLLQEGLTYLHDQFGDRIMLTEAQWAWDDQTFRWAGFTISAVPYTPPALPGADEDATDDAPVYHMAAIRVGNPSEPITTEELEAGIAVLDAIHADEGSDESPEEESAD